MDEQSLLKLSLIVSFSGLLLLILISDNIEIKSYRIKDINEKLLEKEIKIKGVITRTTETPGLFIFDIQDNTGTITAIAFKESSLNLTKNQEIEIQGKVKKYKDKLEIVIDEIKE